MHRSIFFAALVFLSSASIHAQVTPGKRDSTIADSLARIRARNAQPQTGRDRKKLDSLFAVLRTPHTITPPPVNQPPTVAIVLTKNDSLRVTATATARDPENGAIAYRWNWGDGATSATIGNQSTHTYAAPGIKLVSVTASDTASAFAVATASITLVLAQPDTVITPPPPPADTALGITPPASPRSIPDATAKPCVRLVSVAIPDDLQAKLNAAQFGDCLELAPGQEWIGNFVIPARTCAAGASWSTIRTRGIVDAPGTRVTPQAASTFAKITTANNQPALSLGHPTCRWQVVHVNINVAASFQPTSIQYHLVQLGDGGWSGAAEKNTSLSLQPYDIIVRRNWIHGQPTTNLIRCIALNSQSTAIVDNWIDDCHAKGFDSQAIAGWNGAGPYLIENNFLAGAGENIIFGGADPSITGLIPSDITIRRNHFYKDPLWQGTWTVKNLFELKNAQRVAIDANVFENNWADGQSGMAIVIKSQTGNETGALLWQGTTDVKFWNNIVKNSPRGYNLQAAGEGGSDRHVARVWADNNIFSNIGTFNGTSANGWMMLLTHDLRDIRVSRTTFHGNLVESGASLTIAYHGGAMRNIRIVDNVIGPAGGYYQIFADNAPCCKSALDAAAPNSYTYTGNVVGQVDPQFVYPAGNTLLATTAQIGFTATYATNYPNKGANVSTVTQATAGVVVARPVGLRARASAATARAPKLTAADIAFMAHQPKDNQR